ncbi:MAG: serine/threonine-protein kinase [Elusimicrobiota bacterium]
MSRKSVHVLAAAGLLALCGAFAAAEGSPDGRATSVALGDAQRSLRKIVDEFKPNLGRLAELRISYGRRADPFALKAKRGPLRSAIQGQLRELDARAEAFNAVVALWERRRRESKARSAEWEFVQESGAYSEFGTEIDSFRDGVVALLDGEEAAYGAALREAERRRQRMRTVLLCAGALLLVLAVLVWNSLGPLLTGWLGRRRRAAALVLLCAAVPCCQGAPTSEELHAAVRETEREVRRSLAELNPKMQRVAEVCVLVERGADPSAFSKERGPLLTGINGRLKTLDKQLEDLSARRHAWEAEMHVQLLSMAAERRPALEGEAFSEESVALGRFCQEAAEFQRSAWGLLKKEENLYFAAVNERAMSRRWLLIAAGSGVLFVGVCALIVRSSSRKDARGRAAGLRIPSLVDQHVSEASENAPGPLDVRLVLGGRFRVGAELGPDEIGMLYEAECLRTGQRACARKLDSRLFLDAREMDRFAAYARHAVKLEHPHIFPLFDVAAERGNVWLVHPRTDRRSLAARIADGDACSIRDAKRWASQTGAALEYAHSIGHFHAALCPHNILLTAQGDVLVDGFCVDYPVWLMAVHRSLGAGQKPLPYLAPEAHNGQAGAASDIFSLGAILYAGLTGRLAFPGPDFLKQKREGLVNQPSKTAWKGLPRSFDKVLLKALAPQPKDRYASAGEFSAALGSLPES